MKKHIITILAFIFLINLVSAVEVYVENGNYSYTNDVNNDKWLYVNYSKPDYSVDASWQISYLYPEGTQGGVPNSTLYFSNITIPELCFNADENELFTRYSYMGYGGTHLIDYQCFNGSSYISLHNRSYGDLGFSFSMGGNANTGLIAVNGNWTSNKSNQLLQAFYYNGCTLGIFGTCWRSGGYFPSSVMYSHGLIEEAMIFNVEAPETEITNINQIECKDGDNLCKTLEGFGIGINVFFRYIIPAIVFIIVALTFVGLIYIVIKVVSTIKFIDRMES